jgi:hypothetical protein
MNAYSRGTSARVWSKWGWIICQVVQCSSSSHPPRTCRWRSLISCSTCCIGPAVLCTYRGTWSLDCCHRRKKTIQFQCPPQFWPPHLLISSYDYIHVHGPYACRGICNSKLILLLKSHNDFKPTFVQGMKKAESCWIANVVLGWEFWKPRHFMPSSYMDYSFLLRLIIKLVSL